MENSEQKAGKWAQMAEDGEKPGSGGEEVAEAARVRSWRDGLPGERGPMEIANSEPGIVKAEGNSGEGE